MWSIIYHLLLKLNEIAGTHLLASSISIRACQNLMHADHARLNKYLPQMTPLERSKLNLFMMKERFGTVHSFALILFVEVGKPS